jgi:hypothetical protein
MIHIKIPQKHDAKGFLMLARSGFPIVCLPQNTYGVHEEHLTILKRGRIPFRRLVPGQIRMPTPALAV